MSKFPNRARESWLVKETALRGFPLDEILNYPATKYREWIPLEPDVVHMQPTYYELFKNAERSLKDDMLKEIVADVQEMLSQHTKYGDWHPSNKDATKKAVTHAINHIAGLGLKFYKDTFVHSDSECYFTGQSGRPIVGVKEGKLRGFDLELNVPRGFIKKFLTMEIVETPKLLRSYDICDRYMDWLEQNLEIAMAMDGFDKLVEVLTDIKFNSNKPAKYTLEQGLWRLYFEQFDAFMNPKGSKFTLEVLDGIKDVWVSLKGPIDKDFEVLYDAVVPKVIDEDQWLRFFHQMPGSKSKPKAKVIALNSGYTKLTDWYISKLGKI